MNTRRYFGYLKNPVAFVFVLLCFSVAFILIISIFKLPDNSPTGTFRANQKSIKLPPTNEIVIGNFGKMVIEMLPENLGFTVFLPSEKAFERDLGLHWKDSFVGERMNDSYAILTRVLGFCVVPRMIYSSDLKTDKEVDYDSLDGYTLYMSRFEDGMLVVNRVQSEKVDLLMNKKILVHIMNGVIMDAEFEQAVLPDDDD